jgi:hypothetical protein
MEEIDSCKYLYLASLGEPDEGGLKLVVHEARVGGAVDKNVLATESLPEVRSLLQQCNTIVHEPGCRVITLYWPSFIAYAVENESFACNDEAAESTGRLFRLHTKSAYLDYLSKATFASADFPGPFKHWSVLCLDHIINVASTDEPAINVAIAQQEIQG